MTTAIDNQVRYKLGLDVGEYNLAYAIWTLQAQDPEGWCRETIEGLCRHLFMLNEGGEPKIQVCHTYLKTLKAEGLIEDNGRTARGKTYRVTDRWLAAHTKDEVAA